MSETKSAQRLKILTDEQISSVYGRPQFNDAERTHFFSLSDDLLKTLKLKSTNGKETLSKLYFILQLGYFKARHLFFSLQYNDNEILDDIRFIMNTYMPNDNIPKKSPVKSIKAKIKNQILKILNFRDDFEETNKLSLEKAAIIVRRTNKITDIFEELMNFLKESKIVLPPYSRMQKIIGKSLKNENIRIMEIIKKHIKEPIINAIENLLSLEDAFYKITELKFDAKCFQTQEMKYELSKLEMCTSIYLFYSEISEKLALSRKNIEYYSDLAKHYTVYRLKRLPKELTYFYLICYVQQRYERLVNNLIQGHMYYVDKYDAEAKKDVSVNLPNSNVKFEENKKPIGKLMQIYTDDEIMKLSGKAIRKKAYKIMDKESIIEISQALIGWKINDIKLKLTWEFHKQNFRCILTNLRLLFCAIDFEGYPNLGNLTTAIKYLKSLFAENKKLSDMEFKDIPIKHITAKVLHHFLEIKEIGTKKTAKKTINAYQYEYHIYKLIRENIRKRKIFVNTSTEYKSFEKDIKIYPDYEKNKDKILKNLNNKVLLTPIGEILNFLEDIVEKQIERTNRRALNGENKDIKITHHRDGSVTWTIPYPKKNTEYNDPFFDNVEYVTISEVYDFVAQKFCFMKAFTHIKPHFSKSKQDYLGIKAVILGNGTAQGKHQFSKRSNLKLQRLITAEKNYIRLETLRNAADEIINGLIKLPIFDVYDINNEKHGSQDGKKKKTRRRILRSRYSQKYFGCDIGVVIMTMILNHIPVVTNIIGANEHESHYTYSILKNNNSLADPNIISTDTAGTNNINDLMYYLEGKIHAPCYRSIVDKAATISGFKSEEHYKDMLIKPGRRVKKEFIKARWKSDCIPVLAAILSGEVKQSTVITKLSSHDYKNEVKEALWEMNNILKSIHILKYIDDPEYRRSIRKALNRGEGYHQLIDKITEAGGGDFRGMSDLEVEIWNECTRLTALIIIAYNMYILSELYEIKLKQGDKAAIEFLRHKSPIASQHINIGGLYEFSEDISPVDIGNIVTLLNEVLDATLKKRG